jgi:RNA polymerase sigma-70 factor (ECF subfamily)
MELAMTFAADESEDALIRLRGGDDRALAELFSRYRPRLWRMVQFRLDRRLYGRVDADDLLQEAYLDAARRIRHFTDDSTKSFFIWLRMIVSQTLTDVHRRHLGAQMRDAAREISLHGSPSPQSMSISLAACLLGDLTSPSRAAMREEAAEQLERALEGMDAIDREVLAMRHFEELTNSEVAKVLGIRQKAASIRYVRAVRRLKDILSQLPGFLDEDAAEG